MAYIGSTPTSQNFISGTDYFNGTGSQTAFTLTRTVNSVNDVEVVVNNVIQQPNSYTVVGTTLTLSVAPSSSTSNVYVRYIATNQQSFTVGNNTIGYNHLTTDLQADFGMKNRIINGDMRIDQRNAGASVTVNNNTQFFYAVDRWGGIGQVTDGVFTLQQDSSAPAGFINSIKATVTTADTSLAATQTYAIRHTIEGYNIADLNWGTANAKTVTLSFWVRSSLIGTFGGSLRNSAITRSYPFTYTILAANTWEQKSVTIAGDTTGTWLVDNNIGINVTFSLGAGTDRSGTAGAWNSNNNPSATGATSVVGTNGATFYITGVQLEAGTQATTFDYRQYGQELALCQRYGWKCNMFIGSAADATNLVTKLVRTPITMRSTPTFESGATFTPSSGSAGTASIYSSTPGVPISPDGVYVYNSASNWTTGANIQLTAMFTAEL